MEDKVLLTQKQMERIVRSEDITLTDKYNLVKDQYKKLKKKEKKILILRLYRDYDTYDRLKDIKELISIFLSSVALLFTILGNFITGKEDLGIPAVFCFVFASICIILSICVFTAIQNRRSSNMDLIRHILGIIEE